MALKWPLGQEEGSFTYCDQPQNCGRWRSPIAHKFYTLPTSHSSPPGSISSQEVKSSKLVSLFLDINHVNCSTSLHLALAFYPREACGPHNRFVARSIVQIGSVRSTQPTQCLVRVSSLDALPDTAEISSLFSHNPRYWLRIFFSLSGENNRFQGSSLVLRVSRSTSAQSQV